MNGDWLQVALLLATLPWRPENAHPLRPWEAIGSAAYVYVTNADDDTLRVMVTAPEVDASMRYLGAVPPHGEAVFRLPYADARVMLYAPIGEVDVNKPGVWVVKWR